MKSPNLHFRLRTAFLCACIALTLSTCRDATEPAGPLLHQSTVAGASALAALHTLKDDFAGEQVAADLWTLQGRTEWITQEDRLVITPAPNVADHAAISSLLGYSLIGSHFMAEVGEVARGSTRTEMYLTVASADFNEYAAVTSGGGTINAYHKAAGKSARRIGSSLALDEARHRFRRVREHNGTIFFELSADGFNWFAPSNWSVRYKFGASALYGMVGVRSFDTSNSEPAAGVFENVNTAVPAIPRALEAVSAGTVTAAVRLRWEDMSVNEDGFIVERRTGSGDFAEISTVGAGTAQYEDLLVTAGLTYEYRVRAWNVAGMSAPGGRASLVVTSPPPTNAAPVARAGGPYTGVEGTPVAFDGSASTDPEEEALTYAWSFGDGGRTVGVAPAHVYADDGIYTVILQVTDPHGLIHADTTSVVIANAPPEATLTLGSSEAFTGGALLASGTISDRGLNDAPWQWTIEWGDGAAASGAVSAVPANVGASHTYLSAGTYTVRLRVTDRDSASDVAEQTVRVSVRTAALHTYTDEFAGSIIDTNGWIFYQEPTRTTQNDRLLITLTPGVAGYGGLLTQQPHAFAGSSWLAEISQVAPGGPYTETVVGVATPDEEEYVVISSLNGKIGAYYKWRGEKWARRGSEITYNAALHRFRRIREQNGVVYYELSADGSNWTSPSGWNVAHQFTDVHQLHGMIGAGAYFADASAGTAVFENVNVTVPGIPSELQVTQPEADRLVLTWRDRSVNESGFRIERRLDGGDFVAVATVGANTTQHEDLQLQPGTTYHYRVRAWNAAGHSSPAGPVSITTAPPPPQNLPPVARAGGPYSGVEGAAIAFDGSASTDPEGSALSFAWSFGDGSTSPLAAPSHSYANDGTYQVILQVSDAAGLIHADTTQATVLNAAPAVQFTLSASTVETGTAIGLTGSVEDAGVLDTPWNWVIDWGDGTSTAGSAAAVPAAVVGSHSYAAAGSFVVRLRVTDRDGGSGEATQPVTVTSPPPPPPPAMGLLVDDFGGDVIAGDRWATYGPEGSVTQANRLVLRFAPNSTEPAGAMSADARSIYGSAFMAEISQVAGGTGSNETSISVVTADFEEFAIISNIGTSLSVWYKRRGSSAQRLASAITFSATAHRFRRIREQDGQLLFELSADGEMWTRPTGWSIGTFFTTPTQLYGNIAVRSLSTTNSNPTAAIIENTNITVPAAPATPAAVALSPSSVSVSWVDRSVNESGFAVERRAAGGTFSRIATVGANVNTYTDQLVQPGTTYEYRVVAENRHGRSPATPPVVVVTP
jgi:PKD repeat protein